MKYVLLMMGTDAYLDETLATEDVTGTIEDLTAGLRPWLLAYLEKGEHANGWYTGRLVATDEDGSYDTYLSFAVEDVLWFWDEECAPLSSITG
jgi:hypothetical protein